MAQPGGGHARPPAPQRPLTWTASSRSAAGSPAARRPSSWGRCCAPPAPACSAGSSASPPAAPSCISAAAFLRAGRRRGSAGWHREAPHLPEGGGPGTLREGALRGVPAGGRTGPRGETRTTPSSFPEPHAWAPHTHTGHGQGGHSSWVSGRSPGGHLLPQRDSQERHVFSKVPTFGSRLSFFIHGNPHPRHAAHGPHSSLPRPRGLPFRP